MIVLPIFQSITEFLLMTDGDTAEMRRRMITVSIFRLRDACRLIRLIGEPCFVVGHSAGSLVAMELALTHPELIRGIFLYEPVKKIC